MSQKKVSKKQVNEKAISALMFVYTLKRLQRTSVAIWLIVLYLVFFTLMQPEVLMWIGENL